MSPPCRDGVSRGGPTSSDATVYNDVHTASKLLLKFTVYVFHKVFLQILFVLKWKLAHRGHFIEEEITCLIGSEDSSGARHVPDTSTV